MPGLNQTNAWSIASLQAAPSAKTAALSAPGDWDFSFHNLLGIVNPLQHLPVVGTLYRAITGDKIGTPEKIAGDALYGGMWGAISSIADTAFEAATGKNFGDTMIAMVTGGDSKSPTAVAANAPAPAVTAAATTPASADITALASAMQQKGVPSDVAQRALAAYRQTMTPPLQNSGQNPVLAVAQ